MKLYYYDTRPNFGDELNEWLWERLLPGCWDPDDGIYFSGIGTIIDARMPEARRWIVFTSGVGYAGPPAHFGDERWTIASVRGPLTAAVLSLPPNAAVSDGALLLATLDEYPPLETGQRRGVVFVPHHETDADGDWREVSARAGVEYLSPRDDSRHVIERLRRARLVLADSLHAAIVADAFRVPWIPIVSGRHINTFKWIDWTRSMGVAYRPLRVPLSNAALAMRDRMLWLSGDDHLTEPQDDVRALAHFERQVKQQASASWSRRRKLARRTQKRIVRLANRASQSRLLHGLGERRFERSVAALRMAANGPGFLSEQRVFDDRLDALRTRLETIRSITA